MEFKSYIKKICYSSSFIGSIYKTRGTAAPLTLKTFIFQKVLGFNKKAYWPMHFSSIVSGVQNILTGIGTAPGLSPGCYIQGIGKIYIGDYTIVGPNVGIISANHDLYDSRRHNISRVRIGKYCWIGMNAVIMPGVELGNHVIVGANSVVTASFPEGYCVIAGNPAKIIKKINKDSCVEYKNEWEYYGYIKKDEFEKFRSKNLRV